MAVPMLNAQLLRACEGTARDHAATAVCRALAEFGAFTISLPEPELARASLSVLLSLFELPESAKWQVARRSVRPESTFEWVGYGYHRKGDSILHETFDMGPRGAASVTEVASPTSPFDQVTPLPTALDDGWLIAAAGLRTVLGDTGRRLVGLIAQGLQREADAASARFTPDDSTLRILNYPQAEEVPETQLRADGHEDSGALTFIWSDKPGLQVRGPRSGWVETSSLTWTVIGGRVLSEMTAGDIGATTHRVALRPGRRRSVAYFFEPRRTASVLPWPKAGATDPEPSLNEEYGVWLSRRHGVNA